MSGVRTIRNNGRSCSGYPRYKPARAETLRTLLFVAAAALCSARAHASQRDFDIKLLSTRADSVSGGDVLVEVALPRYFRPGDAVLRLNGSDVSSSLVASADGRRMTGLVTGLRLGKNTLSLGARYGHR